MGSGSSQHYEQNNIIYPTDTFKQQMYSNHDVLKLLNIAIESMGITNPIKNKNIPDHIFTYASDMYDAVKAKKMIEINRNMDVFMKEIRNIINSICIENCTHYDTILSKSATFNTNKIYMFRFTEINYKYYSNYLSLMFRNNTCMTNDYIFLTTEYSINTNTDIRDYMSISVIYTTNKKLIKFMPDNYKLLKEVLTDLTNKYTNLNKTQITTFMNNIKTLETAKNKLVFLNEYVSLPFKKISMIEDDFLNKLYQKYLKNHFNVILTINDKVSLKYLK